MLLSEDQFDSALLAIANYVDLKSPYTLGHSRAVAELAAAAGSQLGLDDDEVRALERAGLVHGFGRLGVSNGIWDKAGPLAAGEWERVRMQPYLTGRMLQQSEALAPLGALGDPAPRAPRRLGVPPRTLGRGDLATGSCARRAPTPTSRCASPVHTDRP